MAKVLRSNVRFVKGVGDEVERVRLLAGSRVTELPKEAQKQLEDDGLLVDEKRFHTDGTIIPVGHPLLEAKEEAESKTETEDKK